jgi:hypothetical protein
MTAHPANIKNDNNSDALKSRNNPKSLSVSINKQNVTCYLDSDGFITITASGATGSIQYSIDDGTTFQSSNSFHSLSAKSYYLVVKDDINSIDTIITITQPNRLTPIIDSLKHVSCFGSADGYISLAPTGGNGGYTYLWETGETTNFANNLNGNIYRCGNNRLQKLLAG